MKNKGFTLIELLVLIAIIGILSAVVVNHYITKKSVHSVKDIPKECLQYIRK